jgi:hypothetical protein
VSKTKACCKSWVNRLKGVCVLTGISFGINTGYVFGDAFYGIVVGAVMIIPILLAPEDDNND